MARVCPNCGLHVSDKAKYCRKCGTPIGITNVSDYSFSKNMVQFSKPWENSKSRLGLKGIKSILMDFRKGIRRATYLIPVYVLAAVWLVISLLFALEIRTPLLNFFAFLTYSDGAMSGGLLGAVGGIVGKMIYLYFIVMLLTPVYSLQKPFKGISTGLRMFFNSMLRFKNLKDIYIPVVTAGLSFIGFNMFTGNNNWINSIISPVIVIIILRAIGRKSGITWDIFHRVFGKSMSEDITIRSLGGYIVGILLAIPCFLFSSAFICYYIGLLLIFISLVIRLIDVLIIRRAGFRRIMPIILATIILLSPISVLAAPVNEIKGIWVLHDINIIDPDTNENPKENTYVSDGYIRKHYSVDATYNIEYFWDIPPKKIYAGNETKLLINQKVVYSGSEDTKQTSSLKTSMFITYIPDDKNPEINEYFKASKDFATENMFLAHEQDYTAFFLKILNYYDLYKELNKNNCRLTISVQASFGGRVEYVYNLQKSPTDQFFTWFAGSGSDNEHYKPWGTVITNFITITAALMGATVSVGSLTLRRKKSTSKTTQKKTDIIQKGKNAGNDNNISTSDLSDNLTNLYDSLSKASAAGWPKYKEVFQKTLSKSKDHIIQAKSIYAIESSINRYRNSVSGLIHDLSALGYNNDAHALDIRGEEITNATGKIVYSNYVFNSLASGNPYCAFIELANAFALENMKAGVLVSPSVHLRGIMSIGLDSINDAQTAYRNALNGRYGDKIRNMSRKGEITYETVQKFTQTVIKSDELDKLYESVINGTLTEEEYKEISSYRVYSTKRAVKQAQTHNFKYEETSLVVKSLFDW